VRPRGEQQLAGHLHLSATQRYAHTNDNLKEERSAGLHAAVGVAV
jgi:hypothetical protein